MHAPYSRNLFDLICEFSERSPQKVALIVDGRYLTYSELELRARRIAGGLRAAGIVRGDRVGVLLNNRREWVEVCLGASALGAATVPLSTWSKRRELNFLLIDSKVKILFALAQFGEQNFASDLIELIPEAGEKAPGQWRSGRYPALEALVMVGASGVPAGVHEYETFSSRHSPLTTLPPPGEGGGAQDDAVILYTSGSTSYPKAVRLSQGAMIENGFNIGERQGYTAEERVLLGLPLFWSYGSANAMCAAFTHGVTLVLQGRFEPGEALDLIEQHACTAIYTLPPATAAMVSHPSFRRERTRSLRTGLTIGGPQDLVVAAETLGASEICNIYGQTETYGNCCVTWHDWPLDYRKQVQGPPLPGVKLRIVDPATGEPVPAGQSGLIEVHGRVTPGYSGASQELNEQVITVDGYLKTGDLGRILEDGSLQFIGRDTEMIKRAGINVAPVEIEELLCQHKGVALAGVAGVQDAEKGELIVAFVVTSPGVTVSSEELRAHCRSLASSYKSPDHIEICAQLPTTPTGKMLRRELKAMAVALVEGK